jgi:RimJ/RimL family protein N-acetyltransferase
LTDLREKQVYRTADGHILGSADPELRRLRHLRTLPGRHPSLAGADELKRKVWGRGIATQAAQACLRYAFEGVGLERVIAGAKAPNTTSLRVIEKLGMKCLGNINPCVPDEPYYALCREEFFAATVTG